MNTEEQDETHVYLTVTINIPGQIHRRVHAQWPADDQPIPHRTALAKMLSDMAEELAE